MLAQLVCQLLQGQQLSILLANYFGIRLQEVLLFFILETSTIIDYREYDYFLFKRSFIHYSKQGLFLRLGQETLTEFISFD